MEHIVHKILNYLTEDSLWTKDFIETYTHHTNSKIVQFNEEFIKYNNHFSFCLSCFTLLPSSYINTNNYTICANTKCGKFLCTNCVDKYSFCPDCCCKLGEQHIKCSSSHCTNYLCRNELCPKFSNSKCNGIKECCTFCKNCHLDNKYPVNNCSLCDKISCIRHSYSDNNYNYTCSNETCNLVYCINCSNHCPICKDRICPGNHLNNLCKKCNKVFIYFTEHQN